MIKIALYLGRICEYGLIGLKTTPFSFEMFSYDKNAYSLLGSLKGPTTDLGHGSKHLPSQVLPQISEVDLGS